MNGATIGLVIITLISTIIIIGIGPYIKKVTNCWYFWIYIGSLLLIYMCICRFGNDWQRLDNFFKHGILPEGYDRDIVISKGLLLDICPFTCFILILAIIFDPTRKVAQVISPFALFGGLVTICAIGQDSPTFDAQYIFVGNDLNPMYFMMHYINVVVGTLVLISTPRFKTYFIFKKNKIWQKINITNWLFGLGFAILYYCYVAICMSALNVSQNVSGLNANDWNGGEYSGVMDALNSSWQVASALGFIASIISISLIIFLFSYLQEVKKYYWNNQWNKKYWWREKTYLI